jgi:hypothetical protein
MNTTRTQKNVNRREALGILGAAGLAFAAGCGSSPTSASHGQNSTTNSRDNVFADGTDHELAALAGDTTTGYTATLTVGVAV